MVKKPKQIQAPDLSPSDIKRIREGLGLTQVEAGELLGGGPRAFAKYENGVIKPAAAVANLLRLLEKQPEGLMALTGKKAPPIDTEARRPFDVGPDHIKALSPKKFSLLVGRLLSAEAASSEIPRDGMHVAAQITVADGGEDARIEWRGGPERTEFIPSRHSLLQLKATALTPAKAGKDVVTKDGRPQPMVKAALEAGGTYLMLVSHPAVKQSMLLHEEAIRKALRATSLSFEDQQIVVRDRQQVADWVNKHQSVAIWVLEQTQPGMAGPFRDWSHWAGRDEHESSPWVEDERLQPFRDGLRQSLAERQPVARILGPSGVGKSRLALEALGPDEKEEASHIGLNDLVLYALVSEVGEAALKTAVQILVDANARAIVVIDRCDISLHNDLSVIVRRRTSRLSLITIDHEYDPSDSPGMGTIIVERASPKVVEGVAKNSRQNPDDSDSQRIAALSAGYPQAARLIALAWDNESTKVSDEVLVDRVIQGRRGASQETLKASGLLSVFGVIGNIAPLDEELDLVATLPGAPHAQELREAFEDLLHRGVAQQRGRLVTLQPLPLAQPLAMRQWKQWGQRAWDNILAGSQHPKLRIRAARQLARYNQDAYSTKIAQVMCRAGGPLDTIDKLNVEGAAEVIESLAEIDAFSFTSLLSRVLSSLSREELLEISGDLRRNLVRGLEKTAFLKETFEESARLLLMLATAENERWGNNATGDFKNLFSLTGGATQADTSARLQVLDEALADDDLYSLPLIADALITSLDVQGGGLRLVGAEHHGSRPALHPWLPKTWDEIHAYVRECLIRLSSLAMRDDAIGASSKTMLGSHLRGLVGIGLLDDVERTVNQIAKASGSRWLEGLGSLGDVLVYDADALEVDEATRIRSLIKSLQPTTTADRVRFLVTEMPWDYPVDENLEFQERDERQKSDVEALAIELLATQGELRPALLAVSRGGQRMAHVFGGALAKHADNPLLILDALLSVYELVPQEERNISALSGYFGAIENTHPAAVVEFKTKASTSAIYAPVLPHICASTGVKPADVGLAIEAIDRDLLPPGHLYTWTMGRALHELPAEVVAPLFDKLLARKDGYAVGTELMGMYVHGAKDKLDRLRPQLRAMASYATESLKGSSSGMDKHHFEEMVKWVLAKGRDDKDAAWIASTFARQIADGDDYKNDAMIKPLLPKLLHDFPEIAWPVIGQAIASEPDKTWYFELILGDRYSFHTKHPSLLELPEEALFSWCHAHPGRAPAFAAKVLPILTSNERNVPGRTIHPRMSRLLDEFGEREDVLKSLFMNMHSFGWSGSTADYYALYDQPLESLEMHSKGSVRRWAKKMRQDLSRASEDVRTEEAERDALWGH